MTVEKTIRINFTDEEREAIRTLKSIDCSGIKCTDCPFDMKSTGGCLLAYIKGIARERGII